MNKFTVEALKASDVFKSWTEGLIVLMIHNVYGDDNTRPTYVVLVENPADPADEVPETTYTILRFFPIGAKFHVSADFTDLSAEEALVSLKHKNFQPL